MKDEEQDKAADGLKSKRDRESSDSSFILHPSSFLATGLLGGSFNPPHMAHVLVAAWALAGGEVDEIWVIPTGGHPFGKALAPFADRLAMCRLAFDCFGARARVLDIEREPRVHYSIDTLRELARQYPDRRWRWVMGSDAMDEAPRWREFEALSRLAPPLVVPRAGHARQIRRANAAAPPAVASSGLARSMPANPFALPDLSSTMIRERIAAEACEELAGLIPQPVLDYIRTLGLYREQRDATPKA